MTNTETRLCKLTCREVTVVILHKDPLMTGVGGMLMPRHAGPLEVDCPLSEQCALEKLDCVWALGVMRSKNDRLDLKTRF